MDPNHIFADERLRGYCVYCGGYPETREHSPSRVFLDEPYPQNCGVVAACRKCNESFSLDEEYLACFVECVVCGSTDPDQMRRSKIAKKLRDQPKLVERISRSETRNGSEQLWAPENDRVTRILQKLAISHIDYELSTQPDGDPSTLVFAPLLCLSDADQHAFFETSSIGTWPEIGSRAFINIIKNPERTGFESWRCIRSDRYEYFVSQDGGFLVRILIGGYLACEIQWD